MKRIFPIVLIILGLASVAMADSPLIHHEPEPREARSTLGVVPIPLAEKKTFSKVVPLPVVDLALSLDVPKNDNEFQFWFGFEPPSELYWRSIDPGVDQSRGFCRSL